MNKLLKKIKVTFLTMTILFVTISSLDFFVKEAKATVTTGMYDRCETTSTWQLTGNLSCASLTTTTVHIEGKKSIKFAYERIDTFLYYCTAKPLWVNWTTTYPVWGFWVRFLTGSTPTNDAEFYIYDPVDAHHDYVGISTYSSGGVAHYALVHGWWTGTYFTVALDTWCWFEIKVIKSTNTVTLRMNGTVKQTDAAHPVWFSETGRCYTYISNPQLDNLTRQYTDYWRTASDFEFPPTYILPPIAPVDFSITNMEGCGNWVVAEKQYYHFKGMWYAQGASGNASKYIGKVGIGFYDSASSWVKAVYNTTTEEFTLTNSTDASNNIVVYLQNGGVTEVSTNITVTFDIMLTKHIVDTMNVTIYVYDTNSTGGIEDDWVVFSSNYFNIYNTGGLWAGEKTGTGQAGRISGTDPFNIRAWNDSAYQSWLTYRNLQHVKLLVKVDYTYVNYYMAGAFGTYRYEFGFDYCVNDTWINNGLYIFIELSKEYTSTLAGYWFTYWYVAAYQRYWIGHPGVTNHLIGSTYIYAFVDKGNATISSMGGQPMTTDLWIDLWFSKNNQSSTFGVRAGAYYYGMTNNDDFVWKLILGGSWGPGWTDENAAIFFGDLVDQNAKEVHTQQITMERVWARVTRSAPVSPLPFPTSCGIVKIPVFDLTFAQGIMEGIPTPIFDDTKVPTMPQEAYMGIMSGLQWMGKWIGNMLGPGLLTFWNVFVGFLDTVFTAFGWKNGFSTILSWISAIGLWLGSALTTLVQWGTILFTILVGVATNIGTLFTIIGTLITNIFTVIPNMVTMLINIYNDSRISSMIIPILTLIGLFIPIWEIERLEAFGFGQLFVDLGMITDVTSFILDMVWKVIEGFINIISRIIEAIPVVE